ncbi:MAG: putative integral rane protein [Frankiaceae bacterium]|nr:putative integral rane protein [Frankiaceae bacterium]
MFTLRNVLLALHVLTAILLIGWLATQTMVVPGAIRGGPENAGFVRTASGYAKKIGPASVVVFLLGIWLVAQSKAYAFKDRWVGIAMVLFVVTAVIGGKFIGDAEQRAAAKLESGQPALEEARTIAMLGGISTLLLVVIVWLMVAKPT